MRQVNLVHRFALVGCCLWLATTTCGAAEVASPAVTGLAAISVPAGFTVELVAAAPLVERPMMAAFDDRGRLFVCDSAGVNFRGPELSKNPPHCIRMLEDTDGDGRFDKSTVYADKLVFPQGIVWHDGAVFCSSPPSFWKLEDNGGSHAMREVSGKVRLLAGDHELRLDFVQGEGEAGCILSWAFAGQEKRVIPAEALFHRPKSSGSAPSVPQPGIHADFYELGGPRETFPDLAAGQFDPALVRVALDAVRPLDVRVQAAGAAAPRLPGVEPVLFAFLLASLDKERPALVRLEAAEALGNARLTGEQLTALAAAVRDAGVLEIPKLVRAFEQSSDAAIGQSLVAAIGSSEGLRGLTRESLAMVVESYPAAVREQAAPLLEQLTVNREKQKARLAELDSVLTGGDIQRGRDLFFANKKAICATCHAVQGEGGKIGPDLTRIGAVRASADLLEAIVFPSTSFARGYEPITLATDDGQVLSGIIGRESSDAIYLFNNARAEIRVPRSSIESLEQGTVSIMPEGMDAQLSRQELADLIAFLQSLK